MITDAVLKDQISEFNTDTYIPGALVSSKNMVDSAASYYFDESVIIDGPAAVASMLQYSSDLNLAYEQATRRGEMSSSDQALVEEVIRKLELMAEKPLYVKTRGSTPIEVVQSRPDDKVRNLDVAILSKIENAKESIEIYGKIAYNWRLASSLKRAIAKGIQVKIILDQQTLDSAVLNSTLPFMMNEAPSYLTDDLLQAFPSEEMLPIKWFVPFRPGYLFSDDVRTDLAQEIHAKTIIIDSKHILFGSTNFDSITWSGGFREFSVWVEDPGLAKKVRSIFNRLYNHPLLVVSHSVWLGKEQVPSRYLDLFNAIKASRSELNCPESEAICNLENILQGGKNYSSWAPKRRLIKAILQSESDRIQAVRPIDFLRSSSDEVICR